MTISFAERSDQLCDQLRTLEHQTDDSDTLFYCAYLLGLLGVHGGIEAEGKEEFDLSFSQELYDTLTREAVSEEDKKQILSLLESVK
ncbi:hypothetical protein [Marinomonas algicola]|uniref:hypothetical protein n=1 Tax=Marinomonas algicola TaxID=2773454 RepID=UPI00174D7662|nr:hypothetical protein [Marinomonas algicola]